MKLNLNEWWAQIAQGREEWLEAHSRLLLSSWRYWAGTALCEEAERAGAAGPVLFAWPAVLLSSRADAGQTLNYGNAAALRLWEMEWEQMDGMPSEQTAEPAQREARAAFLRRVEFEGMIRDYSGVRVSRSGRRFRIERATVWSLVDERGARHGMAAMFRDWTELS